MKKVLKVVFVLLLLAVGGLLWAAPAVIEKMINPVHDPGPYRASDRATQLHGKLIVADLHADSLMVNRDLLVRGSRGHVDVPRLIEGNVALQAFTVVTKSPLGQNISSTPDDGTDAISLLAVVSRWPRATWGSLKERALYQARKLHEMAGRSDGKLTVIKTSADLKQYLERRKSEPGITAGFLGLEGAHALEGNLENLDVLFDAGFRMMGPTHFFDNDIGGSQQGMEKYGLTPLGREMIKRMDEKRMVVDLAHSSAKVIDDVLSITSRPVVVSHTGVKGVCDNNRNLTDDQIKKIAASGGVIGIGYWEKMICGTDAAAIARAVKYTAAVGGVDHVALGSDFDGYITPPFDTTGLVKITDALIEEGFSESDIAKIMGGNTVRALLEALP